MPLCHDLRKPRSRVAISRILTARPFLESRDGPVIAVPCSSICNITVIMIQNDEFNKAQRRLAERSLSNKPRSPRANICKAHALTFLGQIDQAAPVCSVSETGAPTIWGRP